MKILLVDDDQAILTVFETALKKEGFEVMSAKDGKTAIDTAKTQMPDFILLDQILPDIKGNEVLKALKTDPATQKIPVAILSNFGQNELVQEAINMGAVDYVLKYQIEPQDAIKKIKEHLQSSEASNIINTNQ